MTALLTVSDLGVDYVTRGRRHAAVKGVSLSVDRGEVLGLIGESGSGKSTLGLALGALLPPSARLTGGEVRVAGDSVFDAPHDRLLELRRRRLGFVFQNPITSLDPTKRIGRQFALTLSALGLPLDVRAELTAVGLSEPDRVARSYPHELSGGMAQRVFIALALASRPELVIADEPTASLDSEVRDLVLDLLVDRVRRTDAGLLLLTHDLRAVRRHSDRIAVMYRGALVESGTTAEVFAAPSHPYTRSLLDSVPGSSPATGPPPGPAPASSTGSSTGGGDADG